jgi:hypothetical protein
MTNILPFVFHGDEFYHFWPKVPNNLLNIKMKNIIWWGLYTMSREQELGESVYVERFGQNFNA